MLYYIILYHIILLIHYVILYYSYNDNAREFTQCGVMTLSHFIARYLNFVVRERRSVL